MEYWPRCRASSTHARIRTWPAGPASKPLGFAGYKAGMTHVTVMDSRPNSITKGEEIALPATIVECPPLKVYGLRLYRRDAYGAHPAMDVLTDKPDKTLSSRLILPKKTTQKNIAISDYHDLTLLVHTQPKFTGIGKKKPEAFELGIGGTIQEKYTAATTLLGKEIPVTDVFGEGIQIDSHAITKGKGFQGPVKRFGINIRAHKSEKTKRGPGNVGGWTGNRSFPVPHAGQTGYHQRMERNKLILKISEPSAVNPAGGFVHYGVVKNPALVIHGSLAGPPKRLVKFTFAGLPTMKAKAPLAVTYISQTSKQ